MVWCANYIPFPPLPPCGMRVLDSGTPVLPLRPDGLAQGWLRHAPLFLSVVSVPPANASFGTQYITGSQRLNRRLRWTWLRLPGA
jgi:hypothetical protein